MKKVYMILAFLAVFSYNAIVLAPPQTRVIVYKGTIKASASVFDINEPDTLYSKTIKAYWAVREVNEGPLKGYIIDSNSVFYDSAYKYAKVIPNAIFKDPCDPCNVVMLRFSAQDAEGGLVFYAVGKGKLARVSIDPDCEKDYVTMKLKGNGLLNKFDVFDPNYTMSGPITVTMTMDTAWTRLANTGPFDVDEITNLLLFYVARKGGEWTLFDFIPGGPQ